MATEKEASLQSCASDPNFAVICSFLNQFANQCGISHPTFRELQDMLEDTQEVSQILIDLHIKLLRKARKSFTADKWERALAKFCHTYSQQDGWELERFGYKKARLGVKVKLLKVLLETQFDVNGKFKTEVNKVGAKDLRLEPLGRDQNGFQYWCQFDKSSHVRIYREDLDDETWELVASDRNGLVQLIDSLSNGEGQQELNSILNEDSTSQEIEKPITDTGQEDDKLGEESVEEEEEEEDDDDDDDDDELEEENEKDEVEQKSETVKIKQSEVADLTKNVKIEDKVATVSIESRNERLGFPHSAELNTSLTGVDLSIRSDSKKYTSLTNDYYSSVPERPYLPERNDILSQMSARFNEMKEAEDLSLNPIKKAKVDSDQPMMLVKKDIKEVIEEPVGFLTAPSSTENQLVKNSHEKPEFSEVIEEPTQYVVGLGSGAECSIGNPKLYDTLGSHNLERKQKNIQEELEFSEVIEEPVLYVVGLGSGADCSIGNPKSYDKSEPSSSYSSTMGIECSLRNLSLVTYEPNFSDVIEEPVMFIRGFGYGQDCLTGNPDEIDESVEDKSPEKKPKLWSIDTICSSEKLLPESLKQVSESSQKDLEAHEGSSKTTEDNGSPKSPSVGNENISQLNIYNSSSVSLKPSSDVKPILENIPVKDKPPDFDNSDIGYLVPKLNKEINSFSSSCNKNIVLNESIKNSLSSAHSTKLNEELDTNQVSTTESFLSSTYFDPDDKQSSPDQAKSSEGVQTSDDISSDNCTSDEKLTIDDQPSTDPSVIDKSSIMPTTSESDVKSFSEDNSRNSVISEESVRCKSSMALSIEDRENSNISEDCIESHSSCNLLSAEERDKSDCSDVDTERPPIRKLRKSFNALSRAELDIESRSSINSDKSNSKRSKCSTSSKNSNSSYSSSKSKVDEGNNCEKKSQIEKIELFTENSKVGSHIKEAVCKINVSSFENGSNLLAVANCSVVCEKLTDVSLAKQNSISIKTSKRTSRSAKNVASSSSQNSEKESGSVAVTVKHQSNSEPLANIPVNSDKNDEKRKNVMLTNIIEVCLDNDTNSKDNGQHNAKFNDLFSAKNLLEPSIENSSSIKKEKNDIDDVSNALTTNSEIENDTNSRDDSKSGLKGQLNAKFSDLFSAKNLIDPVVENSNAEKKEKNDVEDVPLALTDHSEIDDNANSRDGNKSKLKGQLKEKFSDLFSAKTLIEPAIIGGSLGKFSSSNEQAIKNMSENCTENSCSNENNDLEDESNALTSYSEIDSKIILENVESVDTISIIKEEKVLKNPVRGRKSRTNSLNNEEETEVPNKIRKTDNVQINLGRRHSRRNTRSVSQAESVLEPEDEKVDKTKASKSKFMKEFNQNNMKTDAEEENIKELNIENDTENIDKSGKEELLDDKLKESKDEITEGIKKEVDDIRDKLNHEKDVEKDISLTSISDVKQNKGFTLSSFSLEQPVEDGPVLGKPPDFKTLQSRKRRNSQKLSRSEEDGGEVEDEPIDEEAGGKKPRLRGKTRRSKGTPSAAHLPIGDSSSDDDQTMDNLEVTPVRATEKPRRPRGRPLKKRGGRGSLGISGSKSKFETQKESENIETAGNEKESKSDEESDSEKEGKKQTSIKKETKKKKLLSRRDSEKEENKQIKKKTSEKEDKKQSLIKNETKVQKKGKVNSKGTVKKDNKKQLTKDSMEEGTDNEDEEDKNMSTEVKESKSDEEVNEKSEEENQEKPRPKKGRPKKKKTLLGLMESDLIHSKPLQNESEGSRVRQSRRIAQIKIKEEAERRAIEEATMLSLKEIRKKPKEEKQTPKKQRRKKGKSEKVSDEEDDNFKEPSEEKKRGRKKKKKRGLKYDINKPWQSSSDSSSEEAEEEEEHFEEEDDEEDIRAIKVVSDHEFSPESDLEKEEESVEPVRRARTAKKVDDDVEEVETTEDYPCKKCGQPDHPEWILLCDKCDSGYHASCLRPSLMLIPEGDWFCPPCQHAELVSKLRETLRTFERNTKRRENEELRKKRIAYVGISLANVLPTQERPSYGGGRRIRSESSESSTEESESSEEEPVYQLRQRRAALQANYRFNDYDDLINSAIQDEMEAVKGAGNMGRGKDIANIVEAEKKAAMNEEGIVNETEVKVEDDEQGENWRPPVVPKNTSLTSLRKKPKKLTDLDKQSDDDDADSDEDFKGSSDEEEYSSTEAGDSDDSIGRRQPVRRSSRARISRIDKEFINDETESSDEPRRKKTRRIWDSSSSESSDTTWGRKKRKIKSYSRIRPSKSGKKKKKTYFDSDSDRPKTKAKSKRPKIKYGISDDEEPIRRTRGKKMSYLEVAGSDTEEEVIARSRKLISEDEEEFVPEKEEAEADEDEVEVDEVQPEEEIEEEEEEEVEEEEEAEQQKVDNTANVHTDPEKEVTEEIDKTKETNIQQVPVPEPENKLSLEKQGKPTDDEEDDDDQVEEEEIEEEVEEEVEEEEEEEDYEDSPIEEAKNLVREKFDEPKDITQPSLKIGSGVSIAKVPLIPQVVPKTSQPLTATVAIPTPVIKEEKKEEKKEPTPSIRLVPSAKLLDPNKRRPPEESVIRGMLGGSAYYRPQPLQGAGRQPFRQRYPEQQRYLYQPPPAPHHQFYPGTAYYSGEEYGIGVGYEEQIDPNIAGGDEEGVFSGLVSYFSSQREDNLDS